MTLDIIVVLYIDLKIDNIAITAMKLEIWYSNDRENFKADKYILKHQPLNY